MERFRGVPLTDLAAIRSTTSADPESVLVNALNVWFGSVLACETFHADMHAGLSRLDCLPPCLFDNLVPNMEFKLSEELKNYLLLLAVRGTNYYVPAPCPSCTCLSLCKSIQIG